MYIYEVLYSHLPPAPTLFANYIISQCCVIGFDSNRLHGFELMIPSIELMCSSCSATPISDQKIFLIKKVSKQSQQEPVIMEEKEKENFDVTGITTFLH